MGGTGTAIRARSDSSSWIYCYAFSEELHEEWQWSERYPQQQEMLGYLEHVAEKEEST